MKPTTNEIMLAVRRLSALAFFPADPYAQESIMSDLQAYVATSEALSWLISTAMARMEKWSGPAGLRSLYCTRFKPADGIEGGDCAITGFTPADNESRPSIAAPERRMLPGPNDEPVSDAERAQIDALAAKVNLRIQQEKTTRKIVDVKPPAWLENLA